MTWFTENPWPPIFILGLVVCVLVAVWSSQKRGIWLVGVLAAVALAVGIFFIERSIVTERERIEQKVLELTDAFQKRDHDRTLSFISAQEPELRQMAESALETFTLENDLDVKDFDVRLFGEGTGAVSRFRANGTGSGFGYSGHFASRWDVTWQKEGGDWKIIAVQRLNPYKEEKMQTFEKRPH
jgi:ketosteroid isomerase-like protein